MTNVAATEFWEKLVPASLKPQPRSFSTPSSCCCRGHHHHHHDHHAAVMIMGRGLKNYFWGDFVLCLGKTEFVYPFPNHHNPDHAVIMVIIIIVIIIIIILIMIITLIIITTISGPRWLGLSSPNSKERAE